MPSRNSRTLTSSPRSAFVGAAVCGKSTTTVSAGLPASAHASHEKDVADVCEE